MDIAIIVAITENNIIGLNNGMPWHLPAYIKLFK
jgi:dihydrofolate reductase